MQNVRSSVVGILHRAAIWSLQRICTQRVSWQDNKLFVVFRLTDFAVFGYGFVVSFALNFDLVCVCRVLYTNTAIVSLRVRLRVREFSHKIAQTAKFPRISTAVERW